MISIESEERPWGLFYQCHYKRSEAWTILEGIGITFDGKDKHYIKEHNVLVP